MANQQRASVGKKNLLLRSINRVLQVKSLVYLKLDCLFKSVLSRFAGHFPFKNKNKRKKTAFPKTSSFKTSASMDTKTFVTKKDKAPTGHKKQPAFLKINFVCVVTPVRCVTL